MTTRIAVDPVTRIEGHLRLELDVGDDGVVSSAYASGTMVRAIERILVGRDPRTAWALAQRACGVCTYVHALASVRAVEDALGIRVPPAARLVRNMMLAQQMVHDHVMHFYHLHAFDWVDARAALDADPERASELQRSMSPWPLSSPDHFRGVQDRLRALLDGPQPSFLAAADWGHPAYRLPPALDLVLVAHYLEALDWQRGATVVHTIFGGRNPHPNLVVGGIASPIDLASPDAVDAERLGLVERSARDLVHFVEQVYLPDALAVLRHYPEEAARGEAVGNFLTWGDMPTGDDGELDGLWIPRALVPDRDLTRVRVPDPRADGEVAEGVARSWYRYAAGAGGALHPWDGETELYYTGPPPPYQTLGTEGAYSWLKAPRWSGRAVEVGPLARLIALHAVDAPASPAARDLTARALADLGLPFEALFSTAGRTLARAVETALFAERLVELQAELSAAAVTGPLDTFDGARWSPSTWPASARGFGAVEAPRGALGHWLSIADGRVAAYQMVVPTTWNASPRDADGRPGPYEAALAGLALADRSRPLEALRTVRSFDPCLACAVH